MPIRAQVDAVARRIVATVEGDFTLEEILAAISTAVNDPKFEPGFDILSDHTAIGEPLTTFQAQRMIGHLQTFTSKLAGCRWAVATTKPSSYGMMRMVSVLAERIPIHVMIFSTLEEASAWLDGPLDTTR